MLKEISPPPPAPQTAKPLSLAGLVGKENAKRLQAAKVESEDDLLRRASKCQDREALAKECAISEERLLHLTRAVELVRIRGMDVGQVILLDSTVVSALHKLRTWEDDELELLKKLKQAKQKLQLDIKLPDKEALTWWIEQAKHTQSQVEPEE